MKTTNFLLILVLFLLTSSIHFSQTLNMTVYYNGVTIYDVAFDQAGNFWLGNASYGLWNGTLDSKYAPNNSAMPDYRVNDIYIDANGTIWCATHDNGLVKYAGGVFTVYKINSLGDTGYDRMWTVCGDKQGKIWCGTDQKHVYVFDGTNWVNYDYTNSPISTFAGLHSIFKDAQDNLWVAGSKLVSKSANDWITYTNPSGSFTSAAFDSEGNIWGGLWSNSSTSGGGIIMYDKNSWKVYDFTNSPLPSNRIKTIAVDKNDQVWIGTYNKGVAVFNTHSWKIIDQTNSSLPDDRINKIEIGPDGKIWICTETGLAVVEAGILLSTEEEKPIPNFYSLRQNYPNPFNPSTVISYQLSAVSDVKLKVYDLLGKEVTTLVNGKMEAGNHKVEFNTSRLASGVYIYQLIASNPSLRSGLDFVSAKKMILMK